MSDRSRIGLDSQAFSGRLRQPQFLARPLSDRPVANRHPRPILEVSSPEAVQPETPPQAPAPEPSNEQVAAPRHIKPHQPERSRVLMRPQVAPAPVELPVVVEPKPLPNKPKRPHGLLTNLRLPDLRGYSPMHYALVGMGVFVFAVGVFVSVMTAQTNHAASQTVEALSRANNQPATSTAAEPSTIKPGENAVNNFVVAPKMPRYLNIPRLGVHARILSLGILNNGELATPGNIYDVGWYNESSSPGQTGAMMVEGYAASGMAEGVFYDLGKLKAGDQVQVVRGDGSIFSYRVVRNQLMGSDANDMNAAMNPVTADRPGLNLITTADQSGNRHSHGIIVFTEQI